MNEFNKRSITNMISETESFVEYGNKRCLLHWVIV